MGIVKCKMCDIKVEAFGPRKYCKKCAKIKKNKDDRAWEKNNREKRREYNKKWKENNIEKYLEGSRRRQYKYYQHKKSQQQFSYLLTFTQAINSKIGLNRCSPQ